jgi:exosortase/archaeosortase family protein
MKSFSPTIGFALRFVLYFSLLTGAFEASRGTTFERYLVEDCILKPTVGLVHFIVPQEDIQLVGRTIASPSSHLRITRGCEGVEIFLLLTAAIAAFPAGWKARAWGLGVGFAISYLLSVVRLVALHFTLRYSSSAWEALHGLVLPLGPIVLVTLYFLRWTAQVQPMAIGPGRPHES